MIGAEERRRRPRATLLDDWVRETAGSLVRRVGEGLRTAALRTWDGAVRVLSAVALVAAAASFLLIGGVQLLKEMRLPSWLAYGLLAVVALLAAFLLCRSALPSGGRR